MQTGCAHEAIMTSDVDGLSGCDGVFSLCYGDFTLTRMRIWYAIAIHLTDHAVVIFGPHDNGDRRSLTKMYLNAEHP